MQESKRKKQPAVDDDCRHAENVHESMVAFLITHLKITVS